MNVAIVVAAGKGTRIGGNQPKQFLELGGVPIIIHTLRRFEQCDAINEVILVLPYEAMAAFVSLAYDYGLSKVSQVVSGGVTRAQSVRCGLNAISRADVVAVHDGVRPFVTPVEIERVVKAAKQTGAAILVAPVCDTIKAISDGAVVRTLSRGELGRALTPQCFRFDVLKRAYDALDEVEAKGIEVTDDSLLVERQGLKVTAIEGSAANIKITQEEDLALAEMLLSRF